MKFKPEDFYDFFSPIRKDAICDHENAILQSQIMDISEDLARKCNAMIKVWLQDAPTVFHKCRTLYREKPFCCNHKAGKALWCGNKKFATMQVKLVYIEEIKK